MRINASYILLLGVLSGACFDVLAIAVDDLSAAEVSPTNTTSAFNTFSWDYVYNYKGASASAVDHYWILTAAHVADDGGTGSLTIGGETYMQQEVVLHSQASDPDGHSTADIALVRYDKPFPGYYALASTVPLDSEIMICGYGRTGTVVSTFSTAYFTEDGTIHTNKHWGTNRIDGEDTYSSTTPIVATSKGFNISISRNRTNAKKTDYEAGCNIYDSGGGMFFDDGGTWRLVGHMVARSSSAVNQHTGNFATATKYYVNWIKSVIVDYDTDMDGLPDWWETKYGGDATSMERDGHLDDDTFTNYEEWLADTTPTNGTSYLDIAYSPPASVLIFSGSTNRQYQVEFRSNLANTNEAWQVDVDWFDGTDTQMVQSVTTTPSNGLYRVRAKLP